MKLEKGSRNKIDSTGNERSEYTREILFGKPDLFSFIALPVFLILLTGIVVLMGFINYPDIIQANAVIVSTNSSKEIVVKQSGRAIKLFAKNDQNLAQGQEIAWIESTGDHQQVIELYNLLDQSYKLLYANKTPDLSRYFRKQFQSLGELQPSYQQFTISLQQFNDYLINGFYNNKKLVLLKELNFLRKMNETLKRQEKLVEQDLVLAQQTFDANDSLTRHKVISSQEYRNQKSILINKKMTLPQIEESILTNENSQIGKNREIEELDHLLVEQILKFKQSVLTLKSEIEDWNKRNSLVAPVEGKIVFVIPVQENQYLQQGRVIGYIIPKNIKYYAQVNLSQNNFGKISVGQDVQLRLDAYPFQEYGYIKGKMDYISKVPSDSGFLANIILPDGLLTNYKKILQYNNGLKAQAMIITKEQNLLQRFLFGIVKAVQR